MDLMLGRSSLHGTVPAIASKSALHRLLICAALSSSTTYIDYYGFSSDIFSTIQCISEIGCVISPTATGVRIQPPENFCRIPHLDCLECGSTLRFMLPVTAALFDDFSITGQGRLIARPLDDLAHSLSEHGCTFMAQTLPFRVCGRLRPGTYKLPGNISSQYISGLMFALPLLAGDSEIVLTTPLSSAAYIEMTLEALRLFGIEIIQTDNGWHVKGAQKYRSPGRVNAEGDWSSAACWLCAGAVSGPITITGLNANSAQADTAIIETLRSLGAHVTVGENAVTVSKGDLLPLSVDVDQFPDLMPVIAMTLSMCHGTSLIYNAARLRLKESDRIHAMAKTLSALGITAIEGQDFLRLIGGRLSDGIVDGANDHRIIMAAALASLQTPVTITGTEAVDKSYPGFFNDFTVLGGKIAMS
ncbi:MAG: 3-phosphoshikimate 1-carboxyvinyltransferase [Oscillospiraceae bacterium]